MKASDLSQDKITQAAKLAFPDRTALTVTGDAGFLMNSQEIETALQIAVAMIIMVWIDRQSKRLVSISNDKLILQGY